MRDHGVQGTVFIQPLDGGLRSDLWYARDVIDAIADERQVIDNGLRRYAELLAHFRPVVDCVGHRVNQSYMTVYQLRHVLVAGGDQYIHVGGSGARRQRADDVVGLHSLHHQQR